MDPLELIPIDKTIYETMENILEGQVRKLAKDIAKTLKVDEKPLLIAIHKDKVKTYFYEEEHDKEIYEMKCKAYNKEGLIYTKCVEPIIFKKDFCIKHLNQHNSTIDSLKESEELYLVYGPDKQEYYFDSNKKIYDRNLNLLNGKIDNDDHKLIIYKVSNES